MFICYIPYFCVIVNSNTSASVFLSFKRLYQNLLIGIDLCVCKCEVYVLQQQ